MVKFDISLFPYKNLVTLGRYSFASVTGAVLQTNQGLISIFLVGE